MNKRIKAIHEAGTGAAQPAMRTVAEPHGWEVRTARLDPRAYGITLDDSELSLADMAWRRARATPDAVAFEFEDGSKATFGDLVEEAEALSCGLQELGLSTGDTISFQLPNWRESVVINIAAAALGLVINPITPIYRGAELRHILADSRARLIFIPETYRSFNYVNLLTALAAEARAPIRVVVVRGAGAGALSYAELVRLGRGRSLRLPLARPDAIKMLMYTSGTTGLAKGVLHTHRSAAYATWIRSRLGPSTGRDVMFMPSPVTHATGYLIGLELPFRTGFSVALMDQWKPQMALEMITRCQVTHAAGATIFLRELLDEAERTKNRMPTLRVFGCGGAAVPLELIQRTTTATEQCVAYRSYGSTETPAVAGYAEDADLKSRSETDGRISGYDVRVVDTAGEIVPAGDAGQEGELLIRGPAMFVGYTDPEASAAAFDTDGYFRTGDLGVVTPRREIIVTGRRKDLIIRGGENLSPLEIEEALHRHPAVQEAAVVSMPHVRLGESVCAFLLVRDDAVPPSLIEIVEFLDEIGLARQKFPERIEIVASFPRTSLGKVRKDKLREAVRARPVVMYD